MITNVQLAYLAGVIDAKGRLSIRKVGSTELPQITVEDRPPAEMVEWLCRVTGVAPVTFKRDYSRSNCEAHCPEPHNHIHGEYKRWLITGKRASIVLEAISDYLIVKNERALELIALNPPYKPATIERMRELGW